jgi:hypothetical protein
MALASKYLAASQRDHTRATTPHRGACTVTGGLDVEILRGFQLAGELFLLTSFFIEPRGCRFESYLRSQRINNLQATNCSPRHLAPKGCRAINSRINELQ